MNKDQAVKFLNAVNRAQSYLPPIIWDPIAESDVVRMVLNIANNAATCEFRPTAVERDGADARANLLDGRMP
jgi:hypothetical protein